VAAQIYATGQAFQDFLGWNWYVGVAVGFAVVVAYSTTGGFVAVVWSDVFQGALMFLGLVALPIVGFIYAGGIAPVMTGLSAIDPNLLDPMGGDGFTLVSIASCVGLLLIGLGFLGSPQIFVRFLALKSDKEVGKGAAVAIVWTLLADSGAVLTGLVGRHLMTQPGQNPETLLGVGAEQVLPQVVELVLPAILVGLMIAIVLSAIMSTVDSLLVLAGSAVVRDVYQKVLRPDIPDDALVGLSRIATIALAFVALGIALAVTGPNQTVFWFVIFGWSGIAATFCPTVILSLFWRGFNTPGAIAAMVTGFVAVPLFKFVPMGEAMAALGELPPSFVLSAAVGIAVSLVAGPGAQAAQTARN
jgi:SSS family transporter